MIWSARLQDGLDWGVFTMTLAHGTNRPESARLVLRRIAPDDLLFFTRIHALPEVAQHLWGQGRPRTPEESAAWLQATLASYEQLALGQLAVLRKEDGALIGRCMGVKHFCMGWDVGILFDWFKGNGAKLRAIMGA